MRVNAMSKSKHIRRDHSRRFSDNWCKRQDITKFGEIISPKNTEKIRAMEEELFHAREIQDLQNIMEDDEGFYSQEIKNDQMEMCWDSLSMWENDFFDWYPEYCQSEEQQAIKVVNRLRQEGFDTEIINKVLNKLFG